MTSSGDLGRDAMSSPTAASGAGAVQTGSRTVTVAEHAVVCRALLQRVEQAVRLREPDRMRVDHPELLGRVTVEPVFTDMALPPFDNSQMDGYAVRAEDLVGASPDAPVVLPVGTTTAAGDAPVAHAPGTASPVMTGAPIPLGADAVVPIEQSVPPSFHALARAEQPVPQATVSFSAPVASGVFVRFAGSDLERGAEILPAGSRLTPARIGAVAASGITELAVLPRVRVLICSTGDEIAHDDSAGALAPGRIHDSNAPMLAAALRAAGAEVLVLRSDDRAEALRAALATKWEWADVIVTNGGISAGAFEVVRDALTPLGADFLKVAMQPAGPQGSGLIRLPESGTDRELPVLCFPGNPVSTLLSAELFMLPTLRGLAGLPADLPREQRLLAHDTESPEGKLQLRRGNIEPDGRVSLTGPSSHLLARLATADVIAEIPLGVGFAVENTPITVWRIND